MQGGEFGSIAPGTLGGTMIQQVYKTDPTKFIAKSKTDYQQLGSGLLNSISFGGAGSSKGTFGKLGEAIGIGASMLLDPEGVVLGSIGKLGMAAKAAAKLGTYGSRIAKAVSDLEAAGKTTAQICKAMKAKGWDIVSMTKYRQLETDAFENTPAYLNADKLFDAAARDAAVASAKKAKTLALNVAKRLKALASKASGKLRGAVKKAVGYKPLVDHEDQADMNELEMVTKQNEDILNNMDPFEIDDEDDYGLAPGSHISRPIVRGPAKGFMHHGIYVGNGKVVHYAGSDKGTVKEDLGDFQQGLKLTVDNTPVKGTLKDVVDRAHGTIKDPRFSGKNYRAVNNNCEKHAIYCRTGKLVSGSQANRLYMQGGAVLATVGGAIAGGILGAKRKQDVSLGDALTPVDPLNPVRPIPDPDPMPNPSPHPIPIPDPPSPSIEGGYVDYYNRKKHRWELEVL